MEAKDIKKIAVIGAGVIGSSWATNFIWKGYPVNLWIFTEAEEEVARKEIQKHLEILVSNGVLEKEKIPQMMSLVNYTNSLEDAVKDVQFIQEATPDYLELKQKMLARIDEFSSPEAIYASSTSYLMITDIAKDSPYSKRCIGAHPYNPPHLLPLVEITKPKGKKGSSETTKTAYDFFKSIGKEPIILKRDVSGFIGNNIQNAVTEKCMGLITSGVCSFEDVDKAICFGPGLRWATMGPNLIFHLGGGSGGIKGLMMHLKPDSLKADQGLEKVADFLQREVDKEIANRLPEFGNTDEGLREFRDYMLIEMLKMHKKI